MTEIAILWHMHQPYYEDLVTHEHTLPWARLHAIKDYYGMAALLEEFPDVRLTFNLVPSLLVQIEAYAAGTAHDQYLDIGLKPAADLTEAEAVFAVRNFFDAQRARMIGPYSRYAELLAMRGSEERSDVAPAAARRFSVEDLRDLQVWQKLAWIDPFYLDGDARVGRLVDKGRGFTEDDKRLLRLVELELLNATIPAYRRGAERGQVELSTSPFYHPILPLLCDTEIYKRTHPDSRSPRRRFVHPEDALEQLTRAVKYHERLFGHRPAGVWPSEGSVSDAVVPLVARAGFSWMATDEQVLARTLGISFARDSGGLVDRPDRLYRPYEVAAGGARVACVFRDHGLSDLIGFSYAGWGAEHAADDFVGRLVHAGRAYAAQTGGGEAVIPVILDGENAWEHFAGGGRPFLRALYGRLSRHPELRTVTMSEACRRTRAELQGIFPGSWIDANFSIWIGHQDDQRAWSQLADARDALESGDSVPDAALEQAREEVLIAEGSDWCWWYGDDHSSEHDAEFDSLFRRHLQNAYRLLNKPVPDELFVSNISTEAPTSEASDPTSLLAPVIDGEETSYFEWLGAGVLEARETATTMHRVDRTAPHLALVRFGFGPGAFYVRIDGPRPLRDLMADGFGIALTFVKPEGVRCLVRQEHGRAIAIVLTRENPASPWVATADAVVSVGTVLEVAVPLTGLGHDSEPILSFFVAVDDATGAEVERHPSRGPIRVAVPDSRFSARHWTA